MIKVYLSRLLGEKRWSQAQLSRLTGIRPNTLNDIYNEMADRISLEHIDRICEVLDCTISDLMEYIPNSIKKTGRDLIVEEHGNNRKTSIFK